MNVHSMQGGSPYRGPSPIEARVEEDEVAQFKKRVGSKDWMRNFEQRRRTAWLVILVWMNLLPLVFMAVGKGRIELRDVAGWCGIPGYYLGSYLFGLVLMHVVKRAFPNSAIAKRN